MEGLDHSPLLDGDQPSDGRPFHYGGMYNRFYIRTDEWLLIADNRGEERSLYDLRQDPHEFFDVVKENPKVSEELYQQAREKGVTGRSTMSKDELERALDAKD